MNSVEVIQVIKTTRGHGIHRDDQFRIVTQYWSMSGEMLWVETKLARTRAEADAEFKRKTGKPFETYMTGTNPDFMG